MKKAYLLVNLGSPQSPSVKDVRRYLREFLMDGHVIDVPFILRALIVYGAILPFRPAKSARAYRSIWTKEGSPLVQTTIRLAQKVSKQIGKPCYVAMTYGEPSIRSVVKQIKIAQYDSIQIVPLYPHYAMSSTEAALDKVLDEIKKQHVSSEITCLKEFYKHPLYIKNLAQSLENKNCAGKHVVFSFHGLPERHIFKTDPTNSYCLQVPECCETEHIAHNTCYRAQAFATVRECVKILNLKKDDYSISFQSRLGRDKWLEPNTEEVLRGLAERGVKDVLVICPAFMIDCLETLEEIAIRGQELFVSHGGRSLELVPCLNDGDAWAKDFAQIAKGVKASS